jgi:predicted MFS family arabinose efflux permease
MKFNKSEKILLFSLAAVQFTHIVDFMILMPLGEPLMKHFDISAQKFGMLVSAYALSAGTTGLLSAFFMDRFDRKKSLVFLYFGFIVGTLCCGLSNDYLFLLLSRILTGGFGGVLTSTVLAIVGDSIAAEKRGTALGLVMSAFSVASIAGVPFSIYLASHFGWHAPFYFLVILSSVVLVGIYNSVPAINKHLHGQAMGFQKTILFFKETLSSPALIAPLALMCMLILGQFSVIPFISPSLIANVGMSLSELPFFYLIGGITSMIASPVTGRLVDKYGAKKVLQYSLLISAPPFIAITQMQQWPMYIVLLIGLVLFLVMSGRMVPAMTLVTGAVPPEHRGTFMGLSSCLQQYASSAASLIAGAIIVKDAGSGHLLNYPLVGYFAVAMTLLCYLLLPFIKKTNY